jgi:hypothetical protein
MIIARRRGLGETGIECFVLAQASDMLAKTGFDITRVVLKFGPIHPAHPEICQDRFLYPLMTTLPGAFRKRHLPEPMRPLS